MQNNNKFCETRIVGTTTITDLLAALMQTKQFIAAAGQLLEPRSTDRHRRPRRAKWHQYNGFEKDDGAGEKSQLECEAVFGSVKRFSFGDHDRSRRSKEKG